MKTLRLLGMALIALFVSVSFSACSSDDDENQPSSNPLIDTWVGESVINVPTVCNHGGDISRFSFIWNNHTCVWICSH
jgi:hypothetical protein